MKHRAQSKIGQQARKRFIWMERIAASGYSAFVRLVGIRLALHQNSENRKCFAGYSKLAKEVCAEMRSVKRAIALLEKDGWLTIKKGGGRGWANEYVFRLPAERVTEGSPFDDGERVTLHSRKGDSTGRKGDRGVTPIEDNIGDAYASPNIRGRESRAARTRPIDGAGGLQAAAPSKKEVGQQNDFDVLAAIWQRPWADDEREARKAFTEACREADPATIIESARARVAAADEPRFLEPLPKWLAARGWEKVLPTKRRKHNKHRSAGDAMREAGERKAADTDEIIHYNK